MSGLRRIGDLLERSRRDEVGDRRILQPAENLAGHILFLEVMRDFESYIPRQPTIQSEIPSLPPDVHELGEYDSTLLGKLLNPSSPVVCVSGAMGSGKTTTINYLVYHVLQRMPCNNCEAKGTTCHCRRLIAHIDFTDHINHAGDDETVEIDRLLRPLCDELRARSTTVIDEEQECFDFWQELVEKYDSQSDREVNYVARSLIVHAPWLRDEITERSQAELSRRVELRTILEGQDTEWYLRYLVLLWRYLLKTHYGGHRECALVVLDNLDTLHSNLQRLLLDFVMRSASLLGPTFVVLMRPETRMRHGLADELVDALLHQGPEPIEVILDRLARFCDNPERHFRPEQGLTKEQFELIAKFLRRMYQQIARDHGPFEDFIRYAAGRSIRAALLLAQGLFAVRVADMENPDVNPYFVVRACITRGNQQFISSPRNPIDNPFQVQKVEEGRFLLKPRILRYLADRDGRCSLSTIRSAFTLFGYPNMSIKTALNELMRNECQLVRSDGLDWYRRTWGDEQETLYLTAIGRGYIQHLIYDVDFVQEVILDAYVDPGRWPRMSRHDRLTDKLTLLYLFLRDIHEADLDEVGDFVDRRGSFKYSQLFGSRLISLDIIQEIYQSVGRILCNVATKYTRHRADYRELLAQFTSLVRVAESKNNDVLGVMPGSVDEIII